ncbi:MAG: immunoglobulin-like domain-containing protein [Bacilli bacterium]|jgi:peptidoglycan/xylan/chitin deacetylase (PgdA/CDA1 family)
MINKRNGFLLLIVIIIVGVIFYLISIIPQIKLIGEKEVVIPLYSYFKEPGYQINIKDKDSVIIKGEVNTKKIGNYKITYTLKNLFWKTSQIRIVKVIDDLSPEIILRGKSNLSLCPHEEYEEEGYQAIDNYDGDLTDQVEIIEEDNIIIYQVSDSSNNQTRVKRHVLKEDKTPPVITLKGSSTLTLIQGTKYQESGYTVVDNCDFNLQDKVKISGQVDYEKIGTYKLVYSVTDNSGNTSKVTRTITVILPPAPKNSTIYLTFDDGPSEVTPTILNILKEEGVKATFFVMNRSDSYNYLIKRVVDEGHAIALHTYTHDYYKIYNSVPAFFNDLNLISDKVYNLTGIRSKIIRFAGGSSNTVSRFNPGIMTVLTNEVTKRGYRYYDWNVSSHDTSNINSSKVYNNVIKEITNRETNVVLMHDYSGNLKTVNALRDIIKWGKKNGYKFDKIRETTPQVRHRLNN